MNADSELPTPLELARTIVEGDGTGPWPQEDGARLALAWALKDICYASWSSEPQRAAVAADALHRLWVDGRADGADTTPPREIGALADWTAGIAQITQGRMNDAAISFDRAAAVFRELGQANHAAQTQVPRIIALTMLGQYDAAVACALATQREFVAQGDMRAAGKVSLNLGNLNMRRDAYAQAAGQYREAAVLFARVGDHELSVMADIGLADALTARGDFDEAMRMYARARMRAERHVLPVLEAMVEESVALLDLARGHYRHALAGLESSRAGYERLAMPLHLAIAEKQLGDAYLELKLLPEALALFDQALLKFESLALPNDHVYPWTLAQRGRVLALMGRHPLADDALARAAERFAAQHNQVGAAAVTLARAELALAGGHAQAACDLAGQAAQAFTATGFGEGHTRAQAVQAHAALQAGRVGDAARWFDTTLVRARELQLLTVQVRCLAGQGLVARERGDDVAAREAFEASIALFEDQRRALPGDDIRGAFLADHLLPYQEVLRLDLAAHARDDAPERAAAVLAQLDRVRARSLSERLAHAPGGGGGDAGHGRDNADTLALRARLNWLYRRTLRLDDDTEAPPALHEELRRGEQALLELTRRQRLGAPTLDEAAIDDHSIPLRSLQDQLAPADALLVYGVLDDELLACLVTREGIAVHRRLAHWPQVIEALRAARFQIETLRHGAAPVRRHLPMLTERAQQRMQALHKLVWAPLAPALGGRGRVMIVPHAQLGSLPFAALHDGQCTLAQRHELALAPSVRLAWRGMVRQPVPAQHALVLGESSHLAHAAPEARLVARLFAQQGGVLGEAFVDQRASLANLRAHAHQADVIHLACHAQFREDNPMFSALHLADGALTVEMAQGLRLRPGLVVLSGCETGLAEHGGGDDMVGLVRAFLGAGAARVVASLWPVDDAVTEAFMSAFYGALRAGLSSAAALRLAQGQLMARHPHPFYWAAFTLHGGW